MKAPEDPDDLPGRIRVVASTTSIKCRAAHKAPWSRNRNMTKQVGIIGCGGIARAHVDGYRANHAEIVALHDVNAAGAEALKKQKSLNAALYSDLEDFLNHPGLEAISICTPPVAHEEAATRALRKNMPVLCEKPLAHSIESGKRLCEIAAASEAPLMVGFRHRFLPAINELKSRIDSGDIGNIIWFDNTFCAPAFGMDKTWFSKRSVAGGGTLMDTSIHSIDLFRYLFGDVIDQHCVWHRHFDDTDVEDASILTMKSLSGVLGTALASWHAGVAKCTIEVMGTKGRLLYDYEKPAALKFQPADGEWQCLETIPSNGFAEEIEVYFETIDGKRDLTCSAFDGLRSVEIALSVIRETIE